MSLFLLYFSSSDIILEEPEAEEEDMEEAVNVNCDIST